MRTKLRGLQNPRHRPAAAPVRSGHGAWEGGRAAAQRGDWEEAERCFRLALELAPADVLMWLNLAQACLRQGDSAGAAESLVKVLELEPDNRLGRQMASEVFGRWLLVSSNLPRDLRQLPAHLLKDPVFLTQLGQTVWSAGKPADAVTVVLQALAAKPAHVPAHELLVWCMRDLGLKAEAAECAKTVLALAPGHLSAKIHLLFDQRGACDWRDLEQRLAEVVEALEAMPDTAAKQLGPFGLISLGVEPRLQRKVAEVASRWMAREVATCSRPATGRRTPGLLRIGFLSADFRNHPVAQLVTEFIEQLDRKRCRVYLYANGPSDDSVWRQRLQGAADVFADMRDESSAVIAHRIREDDVDVLIDLGGHTRGARLGVLSLRPAAVQATYLGYPGTTGHEEIDYLIGDPVVTPLESAAHYSEKIAQLPGCLIPGSGHRPPVIQVSREHFGLPEDAFVMCALNQPYKLLPGTFDIWCEVLREVPHAVLWLSAPNEDVVTNLSEQAAQRGVSPHQLVFANRVSHDEYFNRFAAADVFVDTWPYGAHTTASDALWAGLPLLTLEGTGFAGRVGASLMCSAGLQEFVCPDVASYRERLLAFARNPARLVQARRQLDVRRHEMALFDAKRFANEFLSLVEAMHQRRLQGQAPSHLTARGPLENEASVAPGQAQVQARGQVHGRPAVVTNEPTQPALRLHLGGKEPKSGWKIVNIQAGPGVDILGDIRDMSQFADDSVQAIYASHVLEHIGQQAVLSTLKGLRRILTPGGQLSISVPDLEVLSRVIIDPSASLDKRFLAMRMMFGGQVDSHDFHYFGWTWDFMCSFLKSAGFSRVERVQDFGLFRDASSLRPWGDLISLNVVAMK
ncbi:MAG: tetratricopeptide repeat protein [Betaproteobacteria bacterium]